MLRAIIFVLIVAAIGNTVVGAQPLPPTNCTFDVYFSPYDDLEGVVHQELSNAKSTVFFSLYGISNHTLADDLVRLAKAGLVIQGGEDKKQAAGKSDLHTLLEKAGVDLVIKPVRMLEHNKMVEIDDHVAIIGSWNWSQVANRQDNSIAIFRGCPEVTKKVKDAIIRIMERDSPE